MSSDQLVTVDDSDTQSIHYTNPAIIDEFWTPLQPPNDPNVWAGTLMEADAAGLSAVFSFKGSQVFVYGRLQPPQNGSEPPLSLYSVGDNKFQAFPAPSVGSVADNVSFFNSSVMPYGEYTLVINITRASRDAPYFLDYIRYNITDPNAQPSQTSSSSTSTSSGAAGSSTSAAAATKGSSSTPIGPIVGGVVAGVAVIAAAIIAFLCYRMRKRRPILSLSPTDPTAPSSRITPYIVPSHAGSQSHFSDLPAMPYSPNMRQTGSMYSLGTSAAEHAKSPLSSKALAARMDRQAAAGGGSHSAAGSAYAGSSAGERSTYHDSAAPPSSVAGGGTTYSRTHSSPMSSVHDLPNFVPRGQGHTKGVRSESASLLAAGPDGASGSNVGVGGTNAQEDSGLRFQPGLTPSDVAPVLPPGTVPIRSTATMSEVARADIPPAYTPD
ncbi:hypothetical protein FKP32DRAFT_1569744 [Trametes sanguinea]|nr:hypothetical protein FKP32DRAFT_1569744 [Trametes sanguinea]